MVVKKEKLKLLVDTICLQNVSEKIQRIFRLCIYAADTSMLDVIYSFTVTIFLHRPILLEFMASIFFAATRATYFLPPISNLVFVIVSNFSKKHKVWMLLLTLIICSLSSSSLTLIFWCTR